jgi:uroporphyrinogen decarboxylase
MYSRPDLMHRMLAINADAVALYLNARRSKPARRR